MKLRGRTQSKELVAALSQGRKLLIAGKQQEALDFLEQAVRRFPKDPEIRVLYATVLLAFRPEEVGAEATRAAELGSDNPGVLVMAGQRLLFAGDLETARSCAVRASELVEPGFLHMSSLFNLTGLIAASDGDNDLAEEKLRAAVKGEPSNESFVKNAAVFLAEKGRLSEAVEVLDEGLKHAESKDALESMRAQMAKEVEGQ